MLWIVSVVEMYDVPVCLISAAVVSTWTFPLNSKIANYPEEFLGK